jgi:hypothetical protein
MTPTVCDRRPIVRALVILALCAGVAHAEPSDRTLVYLGLGLTPPMYLLGVGIHEGSHAVAGKLVGATIDDIHLFPPGRDPKSGHFRFGWTYAHGLKTRSDRIWFYIAPKITDAVLLGGFAGLVLTDAWPSNRYGQLALTVVATGLFVDFAKDIFLFHAGNDVVKVFDLWCMTGWKQVPARIVYAAANVGFGYLVYRGFRRTFDDDAPASMSSALVLPVLSVGF